MRRALSRAGRYGWVGRGWDRLRWRRRAADLGVGAVLMHFLLVAEDRLVSAPMASAVVVAVVAVSIFVALSASQLRGRGVCSLQD